MKENIVLFVDDEKNVLSAIKRAVLDERYTALFADSAAQALDILEKEAVSVIVTDMRMPEMDGLALLKAVKEKSPHTVRIVLSGYAVISQVLATVNQADVFKFITKPWRMEEDLLHVVRQAVDYYNLQTEKERLQEMLTKRNAAYHHLVQDMDSKLSAYKRDMSVIKELYTWKLSLKLDTPAQKLFAEEIVGKFLAGVPFSKRELGVTAFLDEMEDFFSDNNLQYQKVCINCDADDFKMTLFPNWLLYFLDLAAARIFSIADDQKIILEINAERGRLSTVVQVYMADQQEAALNSYMAGLQMLKHIAAEYYGINVIYRKEEYGILLVLDTTIPMVSVHETANE